MFSTTIPSFSTLGVVQTGSQRPAMSRLQFQGTAPPADTLEKTDKPNADLYPGSPNLTGAIGFISKPNEVTAILAIMDGSVTDIWSGKEVPYQPGDVRMYYGFNEEKKMHDWNVCAPSIFARTYTDESGKYFNQGTDKAPVISLEPGKRTKAIKRAPGKVLIVPPGTTVHTLETLKGKTDPVVVKEGEAVVLDIDGNPYVQGIKGFLLKKNVPEPGNAASIALFEKLTKQYS